MNVLLIGSGGREHALAWKLTQSPRVDRLFVAPGNGGSARMAKTENVPIPADDLAALADFAATAGVDFTLVGPEAPLVDGIVDLFQAADLAIFGPTQAAAQLEGSKAFAKAFMQRHGIPTARAETFTDFDAATRYLRQLDEPPVIKASGLAAGKGVILPETLTEAAEVLRRILLERRFGQAGETVLIEERLSGPELSVLAFTDGRHLALMPAAQDHKRLLDGDRGPNTGGMGAFAPSPLATPALLEQVRAHILQPTLDGMAAAGTPYTGVLYVGLMLAEAGPKVLEYNCRFGDPEAQVIVPLLESDLLDVCQACVAGRLDQTDVRWRDQIAVTVVMASDGYPGAYPTGLPITGIEDATRRSCLVFHAGTKWVDERLVTAGGRVLGVTAVRSALADAAGVAYSGVRAIHFNGAHYRRDIGRKI